MARSFSYIAAVVLGAILFEGGNSAFAQPSRRSDAASGSAAKNNSKILDVFKSVVASSAESTVTILVGGKQVALGTVVKADGFILTKDSELRSEDITVKFKDGKELSAKKISSNDNWDLAMLKVDAADLKPVTWVDSKVDPVGNWVATPAPADRPIAVGVVSVAARNMPRGSKVPQPKNSNNSGYLGIQMEDSTDGSGVKITLVSPKSPAEKAGLKPNDIVFGINEVETLDLETLRSTIGLHKPGDAVTIHVRRGDAQQDLKATLEKRPADLANRGDLQNSMGTDRSERRTGFPITLQHDTDLKASQCGGPLVDLDGRVIGINIARGGRTDTYAIPAESIKPLLADLYVAKASDTSAVSKALAQKIKLAEALIREANASKETAEKKLSAAKTTLETFQNQIKSVIKEAEDAKAAAEKKLTDAKAALDKLQADLKKENEKK